MSYLKPKLIQPLTSFKQFGLVDFGQIVPTSRYGKRCYASAIQLLISKKFDNILQQNNSKNTPLHMIEVSNTLFIVLVYFIYLLRHLSAHLYAVLQKLFYIFKSSAICRRLQLFPCLPTSLMTAQFKGNRMRNNQKLICDIKTGNGTIMQIMKYQLRHAHKAKTT